MKWNKEEEYQKKLGKRELSLLFFFFGTQHTVFFCCFVIWGDILTSLPKTDFDQIVHGTCCSCFFFFAWPQQGEGNIQVIFL